MKRYYHIAVIISLFFAVVAAYPQAEWQKIGDMPIPVSRAEGVVIDSSIYILGGYSDSLSGVPFIQQFDPPSNWRFRGMLQIPRMDFVAAADQNRIYCIGGNTIIQGLGSAPEWRMEAFSPESSYTAGIFAADSSFRRIGPTGLIHNGSFYVFGGLSREQHPFVLEYNLQTKEIHGYDSLPPIGGMMSAELGDDIYLFGGAAAGVRRDIMRFNTVTKELRNLHVSLSHPRAYGRAIHLRDTNLIMIIGGIDENNNALNTVEIFEVRSSDDFMISAGKNILHARSQFIAVQMGNSVYVMGGVDNNHGLVTSIERMPLIVGVLETSQSLPADFSLDQNYPNPFNPTTNIAFSIAKTAIISLDVFSILGEHIINLANGIRTPGDYAIAWNATNSSGCLVPSGMYFYRLSSSTFSLSKKMIIAK
jgi:N-acetylneuraminic acid mutarotase